MQSPGRLIGKVAIVTGAGAGGIGAVTAAMIAQEGAHVVLAGTRSEVAELQAAAIRRAGGSIASCAVDIGDERSVRQLFEFAAERFGGVDVVHNNAAATQMTKADPAVEDIDIDHWDETMRINLRGTMLMCRQAIPRMRARKGGSIINTASGVGLCGDVARTAYGVSKAGVAALTKFVATQYGKEGIRCNTVCPGLMVTPAVDSIVDADAQQMMLRHHLAPRLGRPEDISHLVVYLASDESAFVNGQLIGVDGGVLAHVPYYADLTRTHWSN
jgi:NAD(P)-dependent dehydrogenase (short-subunit alcohol dehydrogenase family)